MNMFNKFESGFLMGPLMALGGLAGGAAGGIGGMIGPAMGMAGSMIGGAGASAGGAAIAASAEAMRAAAEDIKKQTDIYRGRMKTETKKTLKRSNRRINSVVDIAQQTPLDFRASKDPMSLMDDANKISENSFDIQTDQKRSNLKFALGGADTTMRKAQMDFAKLASGDTSSFTKEVKASAFGAIAESAGFPVGAFENTSAKNMLNFRQMGTQNALGITDFFAKQGTVDPVDPINSMFKLAEFGMNENARFQALQIFNQELEFNRLTSNQGTSLSKAGLGVGLDQSLLEIISSMEGKVLDSYIDAFKYEAGAAGGEELGQAQSLGGMGQAISQIGQAVTPVSQGGGGAFSGGSSGGGVTG